MKIAINCIFYQPKSGGIGEYIYNLVNALAQIDKENDYVLYVLRECEDYARKSLPQTANMRIKTVPYGGSSFAQVVKRSLFSQRFWSKEEDTERFDVFHSPFFHSPSFKRAKVVVTVHDMRFYRYPSTYTLPRYIFLRRAVKRSIANADRVITISSFTKSEIIEAYGTPSDKITVVLEAINRQDFSTAKLQGYELEPEAKALEGKRFILTVGHLEPRKNYDRLMDSFETLRQKNGMDDVRLVIVGKKGHHCQQTLKRIAADDNVLYLNFVSRELLLWLYQNAALFVFPSFYEGFGFPPLEAACFDTISAVANISSMPEVCGDSVEYFDPFSTDDMAESMHRCLCDPQTAERLRGRLDANLDRFSWMKNAAETCEIYKTLTR